ncbi:uncharacterized protein [Ciconia boyciana]|uniref:uncharacterized protein n=1 Tax=Ciconia boyciana TaxID=52775 RepID=UPI003B9EAF68
MRFPAMAAPAAGPPLATPPPQRRPALPPGSGNAAARARSQQPKGGGGRWRPGSASRWPSRGSAGSCPPPRFKGPAPSSPTATRCPGANTRGRRPAASAEQRSPPASLTARPRPRGRPRDTATGGLSLGLVSPQGTAGPGPSGRDGRPRPPQPPAREGPGAPRPVESPISSGGLCRRVVRLRRTKRGDPPARAVPPPRARVCPQLGGLPSTPPCPWPLPLGSSGCRCPRRAGAGERWAQPWQPPLKPSPSPPARPSDTLAPPAALAPILCFHLIPASPGPEHSSGGLEGEARGCSRVWGRSPPGGAVDRPKERAVSKNTRVLLSTNPGIR